MSVLTRWRAMATRGHERLGRDLRSVYLEELRVAGQLRVHAERVPYPALTTQFLRLAELSDGHAAALADALRTLCGTADPHDAGAPRSGRNYWERLTVDLADLASLQRRYIELALHWDADFPETATIFTRLGRETATMGGELRSMVARSDPHAAD